MAKRYNRTIIEKVKCLMFDENVDKFLWAEACNTACYLKNRFVSAGILKTPIELWTGKKPNLSHLRVYGSVMMVHVPKANRNKWDRKAEKHILVGYDQDTKGYRCFNPVTRKVVTSRDVTTMEKLNYVTYLGAGSASGSATDTSIVCPDDTPVTYSDVLSSPHRKLWWQAMLDEIQSFEENETWELVDRPHEGTVVQCK